MDIYSILESKPHNSHYLRRYIKFITYCKKINENLNSHQYTERHHICPRAKDLFPEYSSFRIHSWNKIILTGRQHLVAHRILSKAYPWSNVVFGYFRIITSTSKRCNEIKVTSRQYEIIKQDCSEKTRQRSITYLENNPHPKGFLGKKHSQESKKKMSRPGQKNPMFGKKRPDLSKSNQDPILKKIRGNSVKQRAIKQKLIRFGCNTEKELFDKIVIENHKINITTNPRNKNNIHFSQIAKNISLEYKKSDIIALRRFYFYFINNKESSLVISSTLI